MPLVDLYVTPREPARLDGVNSSFVPTLSRCNHELLIASGQGDWGGAGSRVVSENWTPTATWSDRAQGNCVPRRHRRGTAGGSTPFAC